MIVDSLRSSHDLSAAALEKRLWGSTKPVKRSVKITATFNRACNTLIDHVGETIRYCETQEKARPDRVYVCGGFARAQGFLELLRSRLGDRCTLWDPLAELPCSEHVEKAGVRERGPAFAVAAGLALSAP
jgi:Tfp pilus assembly PilM family ATPase